MQPVFSFFDFCAGIGAGHLALSQLGGQCVGFSEIDLQAEATYRLFFGHDLTNFGDLMQINPSDLPDFDCLIAGFPCQSFSIAGKRAGMADDRGRIIMGIADILRAKNVKFFLLENVKGLVNHDEGRTFQHILKLLCQAGYVTEWRVLNSRDYGVPQSRDRVYIVGVRHDLTPTTLNMYWPQATPTPSLNEFLISTDETCIFRRDSREYQTFLRYLKSRYNCGRYELKELLQEEQLILDTRQTDLRLYRQEIPTLRTGRHGILYVQRGRLRHLSGEEALLLQGFPKELATRAAKWINRRSLLSQAGNAMTVTAVQAVAQRLLSIMRPHLITPVKESPKRAKRLPLAA